MVIVIISHYSKSQIFVQKFNFDKTPTFSRVFHAKFFWQFFSWIQICQQLKSPKTQHFHEFNTKKSTIFSEYQSWIFGQKWRFRTVWENSNENNETFLVIFKRCACLFLLNIFSKRGENHFNPMFVVYTFVCLSDWLLFSFNLQFGSKNLVELKRHLTEILSHFWYRKLAQNLTDKMTNDKFQTTDSLSFLGSSNPLNSRCLKITEKVSFNITSEASYVYILSGQKLIKNGQKWSILASFWKPEACGQTVLPDRSVLKGQKLVENAKIQKFKCDLLSNFQTMWTY